MKKRSILLMLIITLMIFCCYLYYVKISYNHLLSQSNNRVMDKNSWNFTVEISGQIFGNKFSDSVKLYPSQDGCIYLPAFVSVKKLFVNFNDDMHQVMYQKTGDNKEKLVKSGKSIDISDMKAVDKKDLACYKVTFIQKQDTGDLKYDYTFYQGSVNSLFLETSQGTDWINFSKENIDTDVSMLLVSSNGHTQYSGEIQELKSRGNTTWEQFDKKPYQIKLEKNIDSGYSKNLFNMGDHTTWILLALYQEEGFLATAMAYELGRNIGLSESSNLEFIDLYVDNEYRGIYALTEKIRVDSHGLNLKDLEKEYENNQIVTEGKTVKEGEDDSFLSNTGIKAYQYVDIEIPKSFDYSEGYLLELDQNWYLREKSWFLTQNGAAISFKEPEFVNEKQLQYVASLFQEMESALYSETGYNSYGKHYSEYMDIESWIKYFCVQELMMNGDGYHSSTYFYIKKSDQDGEPRIYAGPLWDFDHSGMSLFAEEFTFLSSKLYNDKYIGPKLYEKNEFKKMISDNFESICKEMVTIFKKNGWYDLKSKEISKSSIMDYQRWENSNGSSEARQTFKSTIIKHMEWLRKHEGFGDFKIDEKKYQNVRISLWWKDNLYTNSNYFPVGGRATFKVYKKGLFQILPKAYYLDDKNKKKYIDLEKENDTYIYTMPSKPVVVTAEIKFSVPFF